MTNNGNNPTNQRQSWEALAERFKVFFRNVNAVNIWCMIVGLLTANIIRGAGLFCNSCMQTQMVYPESTSVYAAVVAVFNSRFPNVGLLLLKRLIFGFKRAIGSSNKQDLFAIAKFLAHLVNQHVCSEILALEVLNLLLENPTDDNIQVAVEVLQDCGSSFQELLPQALDSMFEILQGIQNKGKFGMKTAFLIEWLNLLRKFGFEGFPAIHPALDLLHPKDRLTHEIHIEGEIDPEHDLDSFKVDPKYVEHEKDYLDYLKTILTEQHRGAEKGKGIVVDIAESSSKQENREREIEDESEIEYDMRRNAEMINRRISLAILSSNDFKIAGEKLSSIKLQPGQEMGVCKILLTCCRDETAYHPYHGFLGQQLCMNNEAYKKNFESCFIDDYTAIIENYKMQEIVNIAKFYAQLLATEALPWHALSIISMTEEHLALPFRATFLKLLFKNLKWHVGIQVLHERFINPTYQKLCFTSIFSNNNPRDIRFAIDFFVSIELGGATAGLRRHLYNNT